MNEQEAMETLERLFSDSTNEDYPFTECFAEALTIALQALEKQIPMKPIFNHNLSDTLSVFHCECGNTIKVSHDIGIMDNNNAPNYCSKCGCRLDWSDEE